MTSYRVHSSNTSAVPRGPTMPIHIFPLWPYGCMRNHRPLIRTQLTFKVWQGKVGGYDQSIDEEERNLPGDEVKRGAGERQESTKEQLVG